MNWRITVYYRFVLLLATVFVFSCAQSLQAVPAAPNEGVIEGRVEGYCLVLSSSLNISPEQVIHVLHIRVSATEDLPGKMNFTREKAGELINVHLKERPAGDLLGLKVRANVIYLGDERGGLFWLNNIMIEKEDKP